MLSSHGRFLWYELATTDAAGAKAFYSVVMGWETQDLPMSRSDYTLFISGGAAVSGLMSLPENASELGFRPSWLGYVGVDDVDAAAARIEQLGGAIHVPPRDIPDVSRISVAVDPQMATIALLKWLPPLQQRNEDQHHSAVRDAPGPVGWHELFAADWQKAWTFYADLFGWQKDDADVGEMGTYQLFSAGALTIGGMLTKPPNVTVPFWLYYFNVGDIDQAGRRVRNAGGKVIAGPIEVPGDRWILQCIDPQGAIFALVGKRSHDGIGYFEPLDPRHRAANPGVRGRSDFAPSSA
jgi:uncharacterized protein